MCRVQNEDVKPGRVQTVTAGTKMELKYMLTAAHPGNADLFISYDVDFADTRAMRFFKIFEVSASRQRCLSVERAAASFAKPLAAL